MTLNELVGWIARHGITLVVGVLILFGLYLLARRTVPRVVLALVRANQATLESDGKPEAELQKRTVTLESVLRNLIRGAFLVALVLLFLGVFDLWPLLAGLGLIAAAITLAGQAIVLDYLMGILILVEGPFFKGDWISVQAPGGIVEGEVEAIGLRRTTLRDRLGALNSVSNGVIRVSSNLTRLYSVAVVDVQILRPGDLDRAIAVADRVSRELADERGWSEGILESSIDTRVTALTLDGATITLYRRVPPGLRFDASSELRRRLMEAFATASIGTGRWDTPPLPASAAESPAPGAASASS
jgi:moderate conductance mechanosensitive channel